MTTDTTTFLDTLFAPYASGWMEFRSLRPESGPDALWIDIGDWRGNRDAESAELETWMDREDQFKAGVFVGVLPRREPVRRGSGKRSDKSNVLAAGWSWGECDYKDHEPNQALGLVKQFDPEMIVSSGGGLHMYARLNAIVPMTPLTTPRFEVALKMFQSRLRSDVVADCTRIMRLPGSRNHKPGRNGALVTLIQCDGVGTPSEAIAEECAEVRAQPEVYTPDHERLKAQWEQILLSSDDDGPAEEWARMQVWYHNAKADGRQRDAQAWLARMKRWPQGPESVTR